MPGTNATASDNTPTRPDTIPTYPHIGARAPSLNATRHEIATHHGHFTSL